jgi:hypothetical protein
VTEKNDPTPSRENGVGYRNPPASGRFKKGQSGNPQGRPRKSYGLRSITERVLNEVHRITNRPRGTRVLYTKLELAALTVIEMAGNGHQQATKLYTRLAERFGRQAPINREIGFLVVLERCKTIEEWEAKYSPKDVPAGEEPKD